ncbi:hypothetical protein Tco_0318514 [Tanacetum coccineum]
MMCDHNSSDLATPTTEMSVENVSSGLVPQGQKASDYDNSDPVPPRQNVVPIAEKTDSSQQGLEFLFSPLLEEYYNLNTRSAEENTLIKQRMHPFQEAESFQLLFVRGYKIFFKQPDNLPQILERCMFALTVSIVEQRNVKEAMVILMDQKHCRMKIHQEEVLIYEESFAPVLA